jgi:CBS domain-containing protein
MSHRSARTGTAIAVYGECKNAPRAKEIDMRASDIMQTGIVTVSPELSLREFERLLTQENIGGAPVVDGGERVIGVASKTDIVRALGDQREVLLAEVLDSALTVADIMTERVVTASPHDDVRKVAQQMLDGQLHRVVVADEERVLGLITTFDLLRLLT